MSRMLSSRLPVGTVRLGEREVAVALRACPTRRRPARAARRSAGADSSCPCSSRRGSANGRAACRRLPGSPSASSRRVREHLHVIAVQPRVLRDAARVFGMMRAAVEADVGAAFRIHAPREIARVEHRRNARDVAPGTRARAGRTGSGCARGTTPARRTAPRRSARPSTPSPRSARRRSISRTSSEVLLEAHAVGRADTSRHQLAQAAGHGIEDAAPGARGARCAARASCRRRTCARTPPAD